MLSNNGQAIALAERFLLQSILTDPDIIPSVMEAMPVEAVNYPARHLYEAAAGLFMEGSRPDYGTVLTRATLAVPTIDKVYPVESIMPNGATEAANWSDHVQVLRNAHLCAVAMKEAGALTRAAMNPEDADQLPDRFAQATQVLARLAGGQGLVISATEAARQYIDLIGEALSGEMSFAVPTYIPGLDDQWAGGWHKGLLHTVFGVPGTGKSAIVLWSALQMAVNGYPSLFVSLEMPVREVMDRLTSIACGVPFQLADLRDGDPAIKRDHIDRIKRSLVGQAFNGDVPRTMSQLAMIAQQYLSSLPIHLSDAPDHIGGVVNRIMAHVHRHKTDVVFVDHMFSLQEAKSKKENDFSALNAAFNQLQALGKTTGVSVVAVSQPNRQLKPGEAPSLLHLSYAGEKQSNRVLGLQAIGQETDVRRLSWWNLKNRNGRVGTAFEMQFAAPIFSFGYSGNKSATYTSDNGSSNEYGDEPEYVDESPLPYRE